MPEKGTILLVDDDPVLLKGTRRILESAGFEVAATSSGCECLQLLNQNKPEMVLLDVVLPDLSGNDVCKEIKQNPQWADVYVIMLSSLKISSDDQAEGLESGADGYIARPVSNRELVARVKAFLRLKRTEESLRRSEENFRRAFEESPVAAAILGLDRRFEVVNAEMARMLGKSKGQLMGLTFDDVSVPEDLPRAIDCFERLLRENFDALQIETRLLSEDGRIIWTKMSVKVMRDACGSPQYFFPIIQDVTAEKLYENEREQLVVQLRESLAQVKKLSGLLPICSSCKKIRDDTGYWKQVETYISEHSEAEFSHSLCPDCARKLYPEYFK